MFLANRLGVTLERFESICTECFLRLHNRTARTRLGWTRSTITSQLSYCAEHKTPPKYPAGKDPLPAGQESRIWGCPDALTSDAVEAFGLTRSEMCHPRCAYGVRLPTDQRPATCLETQFYTFCRRKRGSHQTHRKTISGNGEKEEGGCPPRYRSGASLSVCHFESPPASSSQSANLSTASPISSSTLAPKPPLPRPRQTLYHVSGLPAGGAHSHPPIFRPLTALPTQSTAQHADRDPGHQI